jgi:hypothetical protein
MVSKAGHAVNGRICLGEKTRLWTQPFITATAASLDACRTLVNMTRTDLAFAYSQLSKFVQYPVVVHLPASERVLQYVCGTYDQGIAHCDLGAGVKNKLTGWVDSDFGSDPDTQKSMTVFLMSLNCGAISWRSS